MLHFARLRSSEGLDIIMYSIQIDILSNAKPDQRPVWAKSNYLFIGNFPFWGTNGEIRFEALSDKSKYWRITLCIGSVPQRVTLSEFLSPWSISSHPQMGTSIRRTQT